MVTGSVEVVVLLVEAGMVAVGLIKVVADGKVESWSSETVVALWLIKVVADDKVERWSSDMVVAFLLIEAVADEEVVSWSSEVVVVGVSEERFCRHQRIIVEVDVF